MLLFILNTTSWDTYDVERVGNPESYKIPSTPLSTFGLDWVTSEYVSRSFNWRFIEYLPGLRSWLTSISWEVVRPGSLSTAIFSRKRLALDLDILIYFPLNKEQKAKLWREGDTKGDKKEKDRSASPFQMKKSSYLLIDASRPRLEGTALSLSGSFALPLIIYSKE